MTVEELIKALHNDKTYLFDDDPEKLKFFRSICDETVKTCMEINSVYHTPAELVDLMSKLIGKKIQRTY